MGDTQTPKPWVTMAHEGIETQGVASREAFDTLWAEKGWTVVDEHDEAPDVHGTDVIGERLIDANGEITDTLADPTRLTKVLAGEVKAADVGVDPALEPTPDVEVVEEVPAPAPSAPFVPRVEGEDFPAYQARATAAGIARRDQLSEEAWNAVTAVPAGQGA